MHTNNTLSQDTPLSSREPEFMHELRTLLRAYGVDNACGTPDYILADLIKDHLRTWRFYATARDVMNGYPVTLNTEQATRVVDTHLGPMEVPLTHASAKEYRDAQRAEFARGLGSQKGGSDAVH